MQEKNVSTPRDEVTKANERGQLPRDLLGGTVAMQEAKGRYLPKGVTEVDSVWDARVQATVLLNVFARTVGCLSGQVFSRDIQLSNGEKDVPEAFDKIAKDVDLQGNNLSRWTRNLFSECLAYGAGLILVDFPMVETRTEGSRTEYKDADGQWKPKTAEADAEKGWRPYFVYIPQSDLLGWRFETVDGKRVLKQLRFIEHVVDEEGNWDISDKPVKQVRVLEPGHWEVWRETESKDNKKGVWEMKEEGTTSLNVIPVVPLLLGERLGEMCACPALEDLAHLNRRHWQATSDQYDLMSWMRRPVWHGVALGLDEGDSKKEMNWGPGSLVMSSAAGAKLESVSVEPAAVEKGQDELDKLEQQMSMFGMRLLLPRTGNQTATQNALESSESDSTLKAWALALEAAVNQALAFAGKWMDEEDVPSSSVNTEFHILEGMTVAEICDAVKERIVSKRQAYDELKRRGLIRDDADWTETMAEIENEDRQTQGPSLGAGLADKHFGA
jgi:hypothetical protein